MGYCSVFKMNNDFEKGNCILIMKKASEISTVFFILIFDAFAKM